MSDIPIHKFTDLAAVTASYGDFIKVLFSAMNFYIKHNRSQILILCSLCNGS